MRKIPPSLFGEAWRYGAVSVAALALDAGLMILLIEIAGWHYLLAGALSFTAGLVLAYALSIAWVFEHRNRSNAREELVIFAAIGVVGLGINELVLWLGTGGLGVHYLVSKAGAAGASFLFNFGFRKWLLFHPRNPGNPMEESCASQSLERVRRG